MRGVTGCHAAPGARSDDIHACITPVNTAIDLDWPDSDNNTKIAFNNRGPRPKRAAEGVRVGRIIA